MKVIREVDVQDYIIFGQPSIGEEEVSEVCDSLRANWLGTGPKVQMFERDFARYKNICASQVAAVNSCTAALHLALIAAGVKAGDEVITTALTFCATVNSIIHAGATPVLADVDEVTGNISIESIKSKLTVKTKAILPVHYCGMPCDMDAIMDIAKDRDLKVIEDCAHSIEGEYKGRKLGTIGDFGCFSFYATKNMTTGEGGMLLAKDSQDAAFAKTLALHGMSADAWARFSDAGYKSYDIIAPGFKYNMMDIQAAIGVHQLRKLDGWWSRRKALFETYSRALEGIPLILPRIPEGDFKHSYHLYTVRVKSGTEQRGALMKSLHERGVGSGIHYAPFAGAKHYSQAYGWAESDVPVASEIGNSTISLPFSASLTDQQVRRVIDCLAECLG